MPVPIKLSLKCSKFSTATKSCSYFNSRLHPMEGRGKTKRNKFPFCWRPCSLHTWGWGKISKPWWKSSRSAPRPACGKLSKEPWNSGPRYTGRFDPRKRWLVLVLAWSLEQLLLRPSPAVGKLWMSPAAHRVCTASEKTGNRESFP